MTIHSLAFPGFTAIIAPRRAKPSLWARVRHDWLNGLARAMRGQTDRGLADLSDAALADIGLRAEDVPGRWRRDPLLDSARCCMDIPFWPGVTLDQRDDRAR